MPASKATQPADTARNIAGCPVVRSCNDSSCHCLLPLAARQLRLQPASSDMTGDFVTCHWRATSLQARAATTPALPHLSSAACSRSSLLAWPAGLVRAAAPACGCTLRLP